jgi:hypothetical protein
MALLAKTGAPNIMSPTLLTQQLMAPRYASEEVIPYTVDTLSGKPVPASSAEWTQFISYHGLTLAAPSTLHLCQEASGNLADSIGALTLTANGSPAYQQAVTGWTRKALSGNQSTAAQRFQHATGPNPSTTSVARFAWVKYGTADATVRYVMANGVNDTGPTVNAFVSASNHILRFRIGANSASTTNSYTGLIFPLLTVFDVTGSRARMYTHLEKVSPTYTASASGTIYAVGASSGTWADVDIMYECGWSGTDAEISDANAKAFFQALGYAISWS